MEPRFDRESPPLREAWLRFEIGCIDLLLAAERLRERRELDTPLVAARIPCRVNFRGRQIGD